MDEIARAAWRSAQSAARDRQSRSLRRTAPLHRVVNNTRKNPGGGLPGFFAVRALRSARALGEPYINGGASRRFPPLRRKESTKISFRGAPTIETIIGRMRYRT